jgi:hypothetical protein
VNDVLEVRLRALGHELELPPEPDLAPRVLDQLSLSATRPFPWRRGVALALALVALAIGAAFAVPQARTAILRFFHLGGATVERVETLPHAVERSQAGGFGSPLSRADAERILGFRLALPPFHGGGPRRVYVIGNSVGTVFVRWKGHRVALSEFASFDVQGLKKLAVNATVIDPVDVNGRAGLWITGAPHTLTYFERDTGFQQRTVLIRGNVLLWLHGDLTLRIEGELTRAQAIELARRVL